jgi:hypothetical protein
MDILAVRHGSADRIALTRITFVRDPGCRAVVELT